MCSAFRLLLFGSFAIVPLVAMGQGSRDRIEATRINDLQLPDAPASLVAYTIPYRAPAEEGPSANIVSPARDSAGMLSAGFNSQSQPIRQTRTLDGAEEESRRQEPRRVGNFLDTTMLSNLLRDDPWHVQKHTGSKAGRLLWAATSMIWCKRNWGGWGPNYSNLVGNLIGTAIVQAYYPGSGRTLADTIPNGLTLSAKGLGNAEVLEFWPDIAGHFERKHEEKLARMAAEAAGQPALLVDSRRHDY